MSTDYFARVVFGILVEHKQLLSELKQRGCNHQLQARPGENFCPKCGKKIWMVSNENELDANPDEGLGYFYSYEPDDESEVVLGFQLAGLYGDSELGISALEQPMPQWVNEIKQACIRRGIEFSHELLKN